MSAQFMVDFEHESELLQAIEALVKCVHPHNFTVELDHPRPRILTSELGVGCIGFFMQDPRQGDPRP